MTKRLVRVDEVMEMTGIKSKPILARMVKRGDFPVPVKLPGGRIRLWPIEEVEEWVISQNKSTQQQKMTRTEVKKLIREVKDAIKAYTPYSHRTNYVGLKIDVVKNVVIALKQLHAMMHEREEIEKC